MNRRGVGWTGIAVVVVIGLGAGAWTIRRGLSAHDEPSTVEKIVARAVRRLAVPARARDLSNPVPITKDALGDARAHFADHCASCHANDGSGHTAMGQNLYPKAPDMRLDDTQRLTDGELYYIIQNGVRLTGMPAWGKADDDRDQDSWKLVHFIRHLTDLTPEDLDEMKALNPKSPDEIEEEREEREFLNGGAQPEETEEPNGQQPHHKH
jgi:mono/diheme cytochrome c family protein